MVTCKQGEDFYMKLKGKEIAIENVGDDTYVHLVFFDDSAIDLKGPLAGLQVTEHEDAGGVYLVEADFKGFELTEPRVNSDAPTTSAA